MFKLDLEKPEEPEIKFPTSVGSSKKQSNFIPLYHKYIKDIQTTGLEKVGFISNPKERQCQRMFKLPHNFTYSHTIKVTLKILQARLQEYVNCELLDVQAEFRKVRRTRYQIANICWIIEKAREFQKNTYFCFIDDAKAFDCGKTPSQQTVENSERGGNTRPPDLPPEKTVCRSRSNN